MRGSLHAPHRLFLVAILAIAGISGCSRPTPTTEVSEATEHGLLSQQRPEVAATRRLNTALVEQKRLALQRRGPSPYPASIQVPSRESISAPSAKPSDARARLKLPKSSAKEPAKTSSTEIATRPVAKTIPPASQASDSCSGAEGERTAAENSVDSSDKLFHLRRALRLCPMNARVHHELGKVYASMGRNEDAHDEYKEALQIDPSYAPARESLNTAK